MGQFAATRAMGGSGSASGESSGDSGESSGSGSSSTSTGIDADESSSGSGLFRGCFGDDFDDDLLDESLWWTWAEGDSAFNESAGWMKFDPPTTGLLDTGLIANNEHAFVFDRGWARMQIVAHPVIDRPVVAFLQVIQEPSVLSVRYGEGVVWINGHAAPGVDAFEESHPELGTPSWVGIRAEEPDVHFEVSDDGVEWTTFATFTKPAAFDFARPLIMVQTYGDYPDRQMVAVDNFETCIE